MRVLILTRYGRLGASSRLRLFQYLPHLDAANASYEISPLFNDTLLAKKYAEGSYGFLGLLASYWRQISWMLRHRQFDLVVIEKEALPWLPGWIELNFLRDVPYVLDYDDAIFHNYDLHPSKLVRHFFKHRIDRLMAKAHLVIAGNQYLASRAWSAGASRVEVIPTAIDLNRYATKDATTAHEPDLEPRIVWIGSPSTAQYLQMLHEPLKALGQRCSFVLRVIGAKVAMEGVKVELCPWTEDTEVDLIRSSDIGVMPLAESPWEKGKCGYKLIQYMACGLPVVASPVGANLDIVDAGTNGYLASNESEWVAALESLITSPQQRLRMGQAGRDAVESKYCIQVTGPQIVQLLTEVTLGP